MILFTMDALHERPGAMRPKPKRPDEIAWWDARP